MITDTKNKDLKEIVKHMAEHNNHDHASQQTTILLDIAMSLNKLIAVNTQIQEQQAIILAELSQIRIEQKTLRKEIEEVKSERKNNSKDAKNTLEKSSPQFEF